MALKFFWRCEGTTLDGTHDFTAGDNTATLNSLAAINTDAGMIGTNGLDSPTGLDYASFTVSSGDLINAAVGSAAFTFRMQSFSSGSTIFEAANSGTPNNHIRVIELGTDDATGRELRFQVRLSPNPSVTLDTTAADLQLNTVYRVVIRWDEPNNDRRIEIYNSDNSLRTAVEDLSTDFDQPTGIDILRIGEAAGGAIDTHIDNVFIADAYAEPLEDFLDITSYTEYGAAGGTVNTETLSDDIVVTDQPLDYVFFNRSLESSASLTDQLLAYLFRNRFLEDTVTVTEGQTVLSTTYQYTATDELVVLDELIRSALRNSILTDQVTVTDAMIADLISYLIYIQVLTSNVTASDDALVYRLFDRLLDDGLLTDDQALRALLVARDLLDGVEVTDDGLTSMQRFILLTDTLSVDDSLSSIYLPSTISNPVIRIGFDQPDLKLGGYGLN